MSHKRGTTVVFTVRETRRASRISERQLWRYIETGELKVSRIGKHRVIILKESLLALIDIEDGRRGRVMTGAYRC